MANLTYMGAMSKGQDGGAATPLTNRNQCTKSYVGGILIGVVGDQFTAHVANKSTHQGSLREIVSGASKTFFEGHAAARVNDPIADGDAVADGNAKTNVE